ncbi:MFS transporter [Frigoriglobus tundricola]|uniref:4-hydroxybenzoate transporter n=1 Tax=Frigoriglobus tundricola TaxID=2774151 RepID=A0A6M5YHG2_9BACT|nr:MFS transporter [Frigoriglobus tundricola]QJW93499.1 4-hydroxybenzoate transporter [Frigoriglobus tundricola]
MSLPAVTSRGRNLALLAALLGWMFDGMEMGLFPLVGKDALGEWLRDTADPSKADKAQVDKWYGLVLACFLVGAATGGVLFGWLGDKIGRVRAMTVSILMYSLCSGLSAASQSPEQLAVLRFVGALGMGGEWALGVALVMELWPGASRALMAGLIGAFGNLGYLICGAIAFGLSPNRTAPAEIQSALTGIGLPIEWAAALTSNNNWRLLMLVGALPALLTTVLRLFVPESEKWTHEKDAGRASHWSERDLFGVLVGAGAAGGVIVLWAVPDLDLLLRIAGSLVGLVVVVLGYLYPARGYLARSGLPAAVRGTVLRRMLLAAALSGVALLGTWAGLMWMYQWVGDLPGGKSPDARAWLQMSSSVGAALGCLGGALLCAPLGRRPVYAVLCVLSMIAMVAFYQQGRWYEGGTPPFDATFVIFAGVLGMISASFYGWLPLYLPELFPTAVRATGQGFGFNFGRIIAAAGNLQMANLLAAFDKDYSRACALVAGVYAVGLVLIVIAPETKGKPLPE